MEGAVDRSGDRSDNLVGAANRSGDMSDRGDNYSVMKAYAVNKKFLYLN